jgi:hypothetical protein
MPDAFFATKTRKRKRSTNTAGPNKKVARKNDTALNKVDKSKGKGKARAADEELESGGSGGELDDLDLRAEEFDSNESGEEDEDETPAEKRLRLAKLYLESVKEGLGVSYVPYSICETNCGDSGWRSRCCRNRQRDYLATIEARRIGTLWKGVFVRSGLGAYVRISSQWL